MALRLNESIVRGEIDNREKGRVTGRIWVVGRDEPIELDLKGNAWPDLAGSLLSFTNPEPILGDETTDLRILQIGTAGDITASRKVRVFQVPIDEAFAMKERGENPPERLANSVYIEWFSTTNGRVVIESADFQTVISEPAWRMTEEETRLLAEANRKAMETFIEETGHSLHDDAEEGDMDQDSGGRMDEFQWERFMQESDRRTDRYGELLDKYADHPDRDLIVAREMGWQWLVEALEKRKEGKTGGAKEQAAHPLEHEQSPGTGDGRDDPEDEWTPGDDEDDEMKPDPLTEGVDWVRDEHGHPQHPLVLRTSRTAMDMWHFCKDGGLLGGDGNEGDDDIQNMLFQAQCAGAKMAGALNSLCYRHDSDPGFVVANLKRALKRVHEALSLVEVVKAKSLIDKERLTKFQHDLLDIREAVLLLMKEFRRKI